ncbi:MAG: tetratricopeptide repeat protein [Cellulophaga sp.]
MDEIYNALTSLNVKLIKINDERYLTDFKESKAFVIDTCITCRKNNKPNIIIVVFFFMKCICLYLRHLILNLPILMRKMHYTILLPLFLFIFQSCSVSKLISKGWESYDEKKYEDAKKYFNKAQSKSPNLYDPYYGEAFSNYHQKNYDVAIENFLIAEKVFNPIQNFGLNRSKDYIYNGLAYAYLDKKDYENSSKYFGIVSEYHPKSKHHEYATYKAGQIYYHKLKYYNKSIKHLSKHLNFYPNSTNQENALLLLADGYYKTDDYKKSAQYFTDYLKKYPDSKDTEVVINRIGNSNYQIGDYKKSAYYFSELLGKYPIYIREKDFLYSIGVSNYNIKNYEKSSKYLSLLSKIKSKNSKYKNVDYYVGNSYYNMNQLSESSAFFKKFISNNPKSDKAWDASFKVSSYSYSINKIDNAISYMTKCYNINPTSKVVYKLALFNYQKYYYNTSINYLSELYSSDDYEKIRKYVIKNISSFKNLNSYPKFQRWISGIRRIKIKPVYGANYYSQEFTGEDLFLVILYDKEFILSTDVIDNRDSVYWNNDYVIFDYKIGSPLDIYLVDEDITENELLYHHTYYDIPRDLGKRVIEDGKKEIILNIEDSNRDVYTTGVTIPKPVSLMELVAGGIGVYAIASSINSEDNFFSKLINCLTQTAIGNSIDNPASAGIIAEASASVIENRNISIKNTGVNIFANYVVQELKKNGHNEEANLVVGGLFLNCLSN